MAAGRGRRAWPARGVALQALLYGALALALVIMALPFLWMLSTAFKTPDALLASPPLWVPPRPTLDNFGKVLGIAPFGAFYLNSLKVTVCVTLGQLVFCSSAAYAFARLRFPGRAALFAIYLSSLLVPGQVTIIPLYIIMRALHLLDNHASLILPGLTSAFGTFLLRQFFLTIPLELEDAARVDGVGPFRILAAIYVPLSGAALATLAIFTVNGYWNDFFRPLVFLSSLSNMTVPLGLAFVLGQYGDNQAVVMAGATLAIAPVLVVYLALQRYMVAGITLTGLKG